jgi:hypothetical protein
VGVRDDRAVAVDDEAGARSAAAAVVTWTLTTAALARA